VNGCSTVNVSKNELGWNRYTQWTRRTSITMDAKVKEKGTGESDNHDLAIKSASVKRRDNRIMVWRDGI